MSKKWFEGRYSIKGHFEFTEQPWYGHVMCCPECLRWSYAEEWSGEEVGCEDCGSHFALVCPECDEYFDHVWCEYTFLVKWDVDFDE